MVHSSSAASPMKTTPSASSHLTIPTPAPPLQVAPPLVAPPGDTTGQEINPIPAKLLTSTLQANSDLTQPSPPSPEDPVEPSIVTTEKEPTKNPNPESSWPGTVPLTPTQGAVNGRTSGRKRTPKACDCCGPNSAGHNVKTFGKAKGRGRGRGRGAVRDLGDIPKRKVGGHLTSIKGFDKVEQEEEENGKFENVQMTPSVADNQSHNLLPLPVTSLQDEPIRNCAPLEKENMQKNEDTSSEKEGGVIVGSKMDSARSALMLGQEETKDTAIEHGEQTDLTMVKSPFGNGDTVNLSDSEPEGEAKEVIMIINELGTGIISLSKTAPASRSETLQDLDSEMQVEQTSNSEDQLSLPVILSNGNIASPTDIDHKSTPMEVETSRPNHGPITVCSAQHSWALRDHRLYCQSGTWEKEEMDAQSEAAEKDGTMQAEESLEQLIDLVHEFLESFYMKYGSFIPLSEKDVLEYLKKNGNPDLSKRGLDIKGEMTRYRLGLASAPIAGFMVMYNKHTLSLEDLGTLEEQNWLNDQVINMYGELIMEATQHKVHFFNSFFHKQLVAKGYDGVKRWTKKVDLFSKWLLLIPIHLEIHWSLVAVTMATKTISYYDSQGIVFRHTTDNIMKYLLSEAREKEHTAFQKGWKITIIKGIPQQKNDSDCGVFVLEYCRRLSMKQPLLFSQEDMPHIRKRIYKELCDCRLND
ncbi:sentrin-specific protease 5-like [Echeneis naucrates]|uniref:sentrin-specific protease 5-like n=1 Tax=Echeneis naucrates TaxID=173247 RepID=UPI00111463EA|nr:sentrin-specific protease 5-like [Echeneis naucrates]XP_029356911.1 sentrin-specific protease 5-like [Echeneis naucrates]XP_029356912.1 sentrin-specific protease 5-like [Echeneis naucrates]